MEYLYIYIHMICTSVYVYIYICNPPNTYLLCSRYVPECLVFLLILSPTVAGHTLPTCTCSIAL